MNNETLYVGCDVSTGDNYFCFLLGNGTQLTTTKLPNNNLGAENLVELICQYMQEHNLNKLVFGVEATSNYHFHLLNFIAYNELFADYEVKVYQLNAQLVRNFKKSYPKRSKTDKYDAFIIADKLRFGRLPEEYIPFNEYEPLKRLTRARFHMAQSLQREMNYFLSNLFLKFSEYKELPFSNTFGATSLALFTEFDVEDIIELSIEELVEFLIDKGKNRFSDPEGYAKEIKKIARNCYRVDRQINDTISLILETSLETIKSFKSSLKRIDKSIAREISKFQNTLDSIPGIGDVFTAGIIAEIGDISNFANDGKLAQYAGLTWNHQQSNEFENDETRMNKFGNKYLRYYLVQAANLVRQNCTEYSDYYWKKYNESSKHKHKRAQVLSARKLVRLIFVLLRDNTLYDPSKYLKTSGGDANN